MNEVKYSILLDEMKKLKKEIKNEIFIQNIKLEELKKEITNQSILNYLLYQN